jgi:hypothetical protein
MFRLVLAILTAWSCVFAQALPAAPAKCHCQAACCAHCASNACNGCSCAASRTSQHWLGSSEHKSTVARSIEAAKAVDPESFAWSRAHASRLLVCGDSYCSRRLAFAAEVPLFKEHCRLLI